VMKTVMKTSWIRAGIVNSDQFAFSKLGHADERVFGEDCRCQAHIELLIA
jgi:hypothetical protein